FFEVKDKWQKKDFLKTPQKQRGKTNRGVGFNTTGGGFITPVDGKRRCVSFINQHTQEKRCWRWMRHKNPRK
ncbi:UNVERIFIED_CONTAM: hypothetical protein Sindi_3041700, partial [Sesamum indicum]